MSALTPAPSDRPRRAPICNESRAAHQRTDRARDACFASTSAKAPRKLSLAEMRASMTPPDKQEVRVERTDGKVPPDNPQLSSGVDTLVVDLVAARSPRGSRRRMLAPRHRKGMSSPMFDVVNLHLRRLARRALNDRAMRGEVAPPAAALLAGALAEYVRTECAAVLYFQEDGEPRASSRERRAWIDGSRAIDAVAWSAACYALARWSPEYIRTMQERGRRGGRCSKRSPTWSDADLDALAALTGLTVSAQAVRLGRSARTVERMRRAVRDRSQSDVLLIDEQ